MKEIMPFKEPLEDFNEVRRITQKLLFEKIDYKT